MSLLLFFFFNDTATTEIYTLSLHDALPISQSSRRSARGSCSSFSRPRPPHGRLRPRSEEHTSELQSHSDLVCRLLLEKKNKNGAWDDRKAERERRREARREARRRPQDEANT